MKRNPNYEAGFIRAVADEPSPEEQALALAAAARRKKLLLAGGALLIVAAVAAGVVQLRRDTPAKQLARAKTLAASGDHRAAVIEFKRSLQGDPEQPEARFLLANEFTIFGDFNNAEIELRKALAGRLPPEKVQVPLVEALVAQGKYGEVVEQVNNASIESPEINAELQTLLGTAYLALGKTEAGLGAYRTAKDLVPNFAGASIAEARYMVTQGRYEAAEAMLESVPAEDKRQSETQALRGDIANALKKPQEALAAFNAALERDPRNQVVRMQVAQLNVDFGQLDLARNQIDIVTKANPLNGRAQFLSAMIAYLQHDLPRARDAVDRALQLSPRDGRAHLMSGVIAMQNGDLVAAEPHLRESIQLLPPGIEARKSLINLFIQRRELSQATEALQAAIVAQPGDPEFAALAVRIALMQGDAVTASRLFEQSGGGAATDVRTSLIGASLLLAAGKSDAAVARLNTAAKAHPDDSEIDAAMVMTLLQLHRNDAALTAWSALERKKPDNARTYDLRAQIDAARGNAAASREALERATTLDATYFPAVARLVVLDLQAQKPDQARTRLQKVLAADPRSMDALLLLVKVEEATDQPLSVAAERLKAAQSAYPKAIPVLAETIAFHQRHDDPAAVLAAAEQGLTVDPNNQDWLLLVGDLSQRAGNKERALSAYTKLTALNNENADYAVRLGAVQLAVGQSEAALAAFRDAAKRAPQRTDLQVTAVESFLASGNTEDATRMLFEVSQKAPGSPMIGELGADIKLAAKKFPEALAAYQQALAATPSTRLAIKTYKAMVAAKQRGQASAFLADWQNRHPTDVAIWLFDAQTALDAADYDRAANAYRKVLESQPDDPAILNNLAWTLDQRKDPKALAYAERAHVLAPNNADMADTLGGILVNQGQTQRGVEVMTKAIALAPSKLDIRVHLAKAQIKDGQKDAARATLQAVIDKAPDSAEGNASKSLLATLL